MDDLKLGNQKLMVACVGNANDPNTFGGLPYHLVAAGITTGFSFMETQNRFKLARYSWNARQYLSTGNSGGFQYSETFLKNLWSSAPEQCKNAPILNLFQLFPTSEMEKKSLKFFYLDQTLLDVFDYYGKGTNMSNSYRKNIFTRERMQYASADMVIFRSNWAANRAKTNYGLSDERVSVVLPGANIPQNTLSKIEDEYCILNAKKGELKLIFVGKEWYRKGLDRLLGAMRIAKVGGVKISLTVVGVKPEKFLLQLAKDLSVEWVGFIDKSLHPLTFARLLAKHDIGVLLSRNEAGGVSLREFGRLGLPVVAPDTGGSPEFAMSNNTYLFAPEVTNEVIAETFVNLAEDPYVLNQLKRDAWNRRHAFDWGTAVKKLSCLF